MLLLIRLRNGSVGSGGGVGVDGGGDFFVGDGGNGGSGSVSYRIL